VAIFIETELPTDKLQSNRTNYMSRSFLLACAAALCFASSGFSSEPGSGSKTNTPPAEDKIYPSIGTIERLDPTLDKLIATDVFIEKLARGFTWAEGPVWDKRENCLYFSDVPQNVVFKWQPGIGTREFLFPSGYTGTILTNGQGANGLALDKQGHLILCQHGDRRVARLQPKGAFVTLAQYHNFRRFNSPNDLAIKSNGDIYFTDPPYGLAKGEKDPERELMISGVYRVDHKGKVTLLVSDLTFPNGIAFSPDEKILYVAISDPKNPVIMAFNVLPDGAVSTGRVFFDASPLLSTGKGVPDGLKVDKLGNLWATGPGGVLILSPQGKHLGTLNTGEPTANCAFGGPNGSALYITSNMYLCRVQTLTRGATN
jgi:gluconolactonase